MTANFSAQFISFDIQANILVGFAVYPDRYRTSVNEKLGISVVIYRYGNGGEIYCIKKQLPGKFFAYIHNL